MSGTVASVLGSRATSDPEGTFLIHGKGVLTFGQVESDAEALAASLANLGIEAGDRVAVVLPPWCEFVVSMFAIAKVGAVMVPLNPHLTGPELQYMLRQSEAVAAITAETLEGVDLLQLFEELIAQLPEFQYLITVGEEDLWYDDRVFQFEDLVSAGAGRDYDTAPAKPDEDHFAIVYTSGTMGKPKGVCLTHTNLLTTARATAEAVALGPEDRVVGLTSLFHVFALGPGILGCLTSGASLILQEDFDAAATLDLIERHRATVQYCLPTLLVTEIHEQEEMPRNLSSLRCGVVAGAPVSDSLVRSTESFLLPDLHVAYSLTEASSTVTITTKLDSREKRRQTVGMPIAGTQVRILDPDGAELPVESLGEVVVRGAGVMTGYYRQPNETEHSFDEDGFFHTGDLGLIDEEGFLHLVGRGKEVIIRRGFNVYPVEVEDRLRTHPAVREVAVVGVQDEVLGEAICACIVRVEGAIVTDQEIKDWTLVTLADYKTPDRVFFLDELPHTGTGKVWRVELSRLITAESEPQPSS